ncbi:recombinase family protein [Aggregatibacter actinomycetemcomitans]|uniref:recombinase family protein n=1 Tax=Aggregatibacter actinomycetemcomitans TaxID=714 RepID=UPI0028128DDF|nr:recombinase family protein [Aggregatibacter actinomycetemcomitans]
MTLKRSTASGNAKIRSYKTFFRQSRKKNEEQLNELLNYIREDDALVVTKFDRLGSSLSQCLNFY